MAYLDTLSDEDRRQLEDASGGAPASAPGGGGASTAAPAAPSSGFQNLSSYFTANADAAKTQGDAAASDLEKNAVGAIFGDDPGKAMDVYGQLDAAGRPDTLATVGQGERSGGESRLDAYLSTRGADPGRFQGLRDTFGDALKAVETSMERPDVREPYRYDGAARTQAAMEEPSYVTNDWTRGLIEDAAGKAESADQARYDSELDPYRQWSARTIANREPFRDLYDYYFPAPRNDNREQGGGNPQAGRG